MWVGYGVLSPRVRPNPGLDRYRVSTSYQSDGNTERINHTKGITPLPLANDHPWYHHTMVALFGVAATAASCGRRACANCGLRRIPFDHVCG